MTHNVSLDWNSLIVGVKQHIVGLLDYESRCHLRTCSKQDRLLVDSTKFVAKNLEICEIQSRMESEKSIIRVKIDTFTIWFIGKGDVTKVDRAWREDEVVEEWSERKQENRFDVARKFLEKYSANGVFKANTIKVEEITMVPSEHWEFKCAQLTVTLTADDLKWLAKCKPQLKQLHIGRVEAETLDDVPHFWTVTDRLVIYGDVIMTDEQLDRVQATHLRIVSSLITPEGVKRALERFLKYGKKTDCMLIVTEVENEFNPLELLPKTLETQKLKSHFDENIDYRWKILGGFSNVHGNHDVRQFNCTFSSPYMEVSCGPYEERKEPCILYPFTFT